VYAGVTERLRHLLKKESRWCWSAESEQVFQQIKDLFIETVHLVYPDYTRTFFVQCDASNFGLGGQVFQEDEEGNKLVISMASRLLQTSEINYTTSEKELLAIVWSLEKFRLFIAGAKELVIVTDHKALTFLLQCRLLSGRLADGLCGYNNFPLA
jgi:RNase H-like domain found in reverse transcriptase